MIIVPRRFDQLIRFWTRRVLPEGRTYNLLFHLKRNILNDQLFIIPRIEVCTSMPAYTNKLFPDIPFSQKIITNNNNGNVA